MNALFVANAASPVKKFRAIGFTFTDCCGNVRNFTVSCINEGGPDCPTDFAPYLAYAQNYQQSWQVDEYGCTCPEHG